VLSVVGQQVKCVLDAINYLAIATNREDDYALLPEGTPNVKVTPFHLEKVSVKFDLSS